MGEVADDFGGGRHFYDVSEQIVGLFVGFFGFGPLGAEAELGGLEDQVCELAAGDFVFVDCAMISLKIVLMKEYCKYLRGLGL